MNDLVNLLKQYSKSDENDSNAGKLKFTDGKIITRQYETELSREIRLLAEVEKIWIIFDADEDGTLGH